MFDEIRSKTGSVSHWNIVFLWKCFRTHTRVTSHPHQAGKTLFGIEFAIFHDEYLEILQDNIE